MRGFIRLIPVRGRIAPGRDGPEPLAKAEPYSTGFTVSVGGFRLPQKAGLSTFSLVIAAPGILMFGPQASLVTVALQAEHVIFAGLDLLLADDLVHEHGDGGGLGVERLLDFDVQPALADQVEADRRAVRAHHHDVARLLAGRFERGDAGDREMRGVAEDQVDVGIGDKLVGDDGAGIVWRPTAWPGTRDDR